VQEQEVLTEAGVLRDPTAQPPFGGVVEDLAAGSRAVERLSTRLVVSSYLWRSCPGGSHATSFDRAWKAILANSCWDI
jgi:hypothetical protein